MIKSRRRNAFTIIELLVVITIISLLVSLLLPALAMARGTAQSTICAGQLHQTGTSFLLRLNDYKEVFPIVCVSGGAPANVNSWCFSNPMGKDIEGLAVLAQNGYSSKKLLACPGHQLHGAAYKQLDDPNTGFPPHAHMDYAPGWHSIIGNEGGLRSPDGSRYDPPNDFWGNDFSNCTPFAPTLTQYSRDWVRAASQYTGSVAMITDFWDPTGWPHGDWCPSLGALGNDAPIDLPHLGNINILCTDGHAKTVNQGFQKYGLGGYGTGYQYWDGPWWVQVDNECR